MTRTGTIVLTVLVLALTGAGPAAAAKGDPTPDTSRCHVTHVWPPGPLLDCPTGPTWVFHPKPHHRKHKHHHRGHR